MPTADSTRLEAVNRMLAGAGMNRTSDISSTRGDVTQADQMLEEVDRLVQQEGWWFNTEYNVTLQPNVSDEIELAENVFRVDRPEPGARRTTLTNSSTQGCNIVKRGGKVYDLDRRSFEFTSDLEVDQVLYLDWADLPETARQYIIARAAREFYVARRGAENPVLQMAELRAKAAFEQEDSEVGDRSIMQNIDVRHGMLRRRRLPRS